MVFFRNGSINCLYGVLIVLTNMRTDIIHTILELYISQHTWNGVNISGVGCVNSTATQILQTEAFKHYNGRFN